MADIIDYKPFVGKTFKKKGEHTLNSGRTFKVAELNPGFDFGPQRGGVKPAFVLHRQPPPGVHTERCDKFLENHEEVKTDVTK